MTYRTPTPSRPRPTTTIPITAPEEKAIFSPLLRESLHALAVLAFAEVAVLIPMFPARAERIAPNTKAIAVLTFMRASMTVTIMTNMIRILYWLFR